MARSRNIKPSLFKNELLGTADPMLTILFASLWCLADRDGRLEDRPLRIKAETFPYREGIDINGYLTELERLEFIHRYRADGIGVIQIVNFHKHQNPHKTEKESELPEFIEKSVSCEITVKDTLKDVEITDAAVLIPDSLLLIPDSNITPDKSDVCTKPIAVSKKIKTEYDYSDLVGAGIDETIARDFMINRKAHKAKLTETAWNGIVREADKANITIQQALQICVERNWRSFKAEWVRNGDNGSRISFHELATGQKPEF